VGMVVAGSCGPCNSCPCLRLVQRHPDINPNLICPFPLHPFIEFDTEILMLCHVSDMARLLANGFLGASLWASPLIPPFHQFVFFPFFSPSPHFWLPLSTQGSLHKPCVKRSFHRSRPTKYFLPRIRENACGTTSYVVATAHLPWMLTQSG